MMPKSCFLARRALVEYLSGELAPRKRARVAGHLDNCAECRDLFAEAGKIVELSRQHTTPEQPAGFWEFYPRRVMARIREQQVRPRLLDWRQITRTILLPALTVALFFFAFGATHLYLAEKEINEHHDLYRDLDIIRNLDLIAQAEQDETLASELSALKTPPFQEKHPTRSYVVHKFRQFKKLPAAEQRLIMARYQDWLQNPPENRIAARKVYRKLESLHHPSLKR